MSVNGDGAERERTAGTEPVERESGREPAAALPRPEIDPALLRQLAAGTASLDDDDTEPWDIAVHALEEVADLVEETTETERSGVADDRSEADDADLAIALAELSPGSDVVPTDDDAQSAASRGDSPEELAGLREIPLEQRIEALLFAATEPLPVPKLRALAAEDDPVELRRALDALALGYESTGRAFVLVEVGGGLVLRTRPAMSAVIARLGKRRDTEKLSTAALETLAIVAYRQPVLRADVEKIRGVASGEVIRTLVERGLVRVAGRAELPGNPLLYGTTQRFLELFGLRNLRDLPSDESLLKG